MRRIPALLAALSCVLPLAAQQTGDAERDYTINGAGSLGTSCVATGVVVPGPFENAYATMVPGAPVLWGAAQACTPGAIVTPGNSVDLDPATLVLIGDGTASGFWASFFVTGGAGSFELTLSLPASAAGMGVNVQMGHLAPSTPDGFRVSQAHVVSFQPVSVRASADGPNSFNANPAQGFFQVQNLDTSRSIVRVVFDWAASSNPAQAGMVFDTDQTGMGDRLDGGNNALTASPVAGCDGTYRNGSDQTTGLVYAGTPVAPCNLAANTGFLPEDGLGVPATGPSVRTLTFDFTPGAFGQGELFEFDADTDFGAGSTGAAMEGCVVTVTFDDMATVSGELQAVGPDRSEVNL